MFSIGLRGPQWSCDPTTNGFEGSGQESDYITNQSGQVVTKTTMDEGVMTWDYTNVYADGQLFATYDAQGLHFQLNDWLGTRRVTTDYAGVVEETCASLPYGSGLNCSGSEYAPNEQHFTGKTHDAESGLDYFGARYYAENDARFLTPDPSGLYYANPLDPQSLNLYGYMLDSPLDGVDQDGHSWAQVWQKLGEALGQSTVSVSMGLGVEVKGHIGRESSGYYLRGGIAVKYNESISFLKDKATNSISENVGGSIGQEHGTRFGLEAAGKTPLSSVNLKTGERTSGGPSTFDGTFLVHHGKSNASSSDGGFSIGGQAGDAGIVGVADFPLRVRGSAICIRQHKLLGTQCRRT